MVQGQIFKDCVLKSVDVIKHVNFQFYRAYPAGVIWQNRLLTTDICIHTRSTFYSSKNCSVKNMSSWMFNKFLLIMTFLYKCVKVLSQLYCLVFIKNFKICSWICTKLQIVYKGIFTIHKIHGLSNINILDKWKFISICFLFFFSLFASFGICIYVCSEKSNFKLSTYVRLNQKKIRVHQGNAWQERGLNFDKWKYSWKLWANMSMVMAWLPNCLEYFVVRDFSLSSFKHKKRYLTSLEKINILNWRLLVASSQNFSC